MARRSQEEHNIRKLTKVAGGGSYSVTIPIEYVRRLGWQEHQKLTVQLEADSVIVKDWEE